MKRLVLCAALLSLASSAAAQQATKTQGPTLGEQIHDALEGDGTKPTAVGALLRDAVNSLGGVCLNAQSYQIFRRAAETATLKVECSDRPLYLLSIDGGGRMILSGGDSSVQTMDRDDGEVVVTSASSAASLKPAVKNGRSDQNDAIPESALPVEKKAVALDDTDPRGWTRWVFAGGLATFGLIAFLGYSQLAHHARFARGIQRIGTYTSEEKDKMVAESAELKPDFYIHPSGLFIVRGKRGKRRLFPNRLYAYIYWRWGLKIAQIR